MSAGGVIVRGVGILDRFRSTAALVDAAVTASTDLGVVSPWQAPETALGSITIAELFPETDLDTIPPSRAEAMAVPAHARIRNTVCGLAGRLPVYAVNETARVPSPLGRPEPNRPAAVTYAWTVDALMHYGRAWWVVTHRDRSTGLPASFEFVPEWRTRLAAGGAELIGHADGRSFDAADVVRFDGQHEGVLNYGARTLRAATKIERAMTRAASNPVPAVDLHQTDGDPMTPAEISELIAQWVAARNGERGAVGYSNRSIEVKPLSMDVENLLIGARNAAAIDLARMHGAPAWIVDGSVQGSSMTYSNVPSRTRELMDYTARGYLDAILGRLSLDDVTAPGVTADVDTFALLSGDFGERMTAYKDALETGVYTIDELRAMERRTGRI